MTHTLLLTVKRAVLGNQFCSAITAAGLYRISTARNAMGAKQLILNAFPPYPEIIEHSIWRSSTDNQASSEVRS